VPNKIQHIQIAHDNEQFLGNFDLTHGPIRGWASTVAFYASLHYVEAFFFTRSKHSPDHRTRDNNMVQHTETMEIYDEFCELKNISTRSRYYGRYPSENDFRGQVLPALKTIKASMLKHC